MLVGVVEALDETIADGTGNSHREVALVEVEATLHHRILDVIHYLLLDEPSLMPQVGTHQGPELRINVFTIWLHLLGFLDVLELRLE